MNATASTHGTVTLAAGQISYVPDTNFNGAASFSYRVCDNGISGGVSDSRCSTAGVKISVEAVNDPPEPRNDQMSTDDDIKLTFAAQNLTVNDVAGPADESAQSLTVASVTATEQTHGTVTLAEGQVTYTPELHYIGPASFLYTVCDNGFTAGAFAPACAVASVNVTVIDHCVANPVAVISGPAVVCAGGSVVLQASPGAASYLWSNGATTPSITVAPPMTSTYAVTTTSFRGCIATAEKVVAVNSLPLAEITQTSGTGAITLSVSSAASYAWSNGALTRSIEVTASGSYSVTVTNDAGCVATSAPTNVQIAPLGQNVPVTNGNVTTTFGDVTSPGFTSVTPIAPATAATVPRGYEVSGLAIAYEISTTAQISGPIVIAIQLTQQQLASIDQVTFNSLRIIHGASEDCTIDPPGVPQRDYATGKLYGRVTSLSPFFVAIQESAVLGALEGPSTARAVGADVSLSAAFTDVHRDAHSATFSWGDGSISPGSVNEANGVGRIDGSHVYSVAGNYEVTVTLRNSTPSSSQRSFAVMIQAINEAPVAQPISMTTPEDISKSFVLVGQDAETAPAVLKYVVTSSPAHGTLSGTAPNLSYLPAPNYNGPDSFQFTVSDEGNAVSPAKTSLPAIVSIDVSAVNDARSAYAGVAQTSECSGVTTLTGSGSDVEGDPLTYLWSEGGTTLGSGAIFKSQFSFGSHLLTLTVTDPSGATGTDTVVVTVVDTIAPSMTPTTQPISLWPVNKQFTTFNVGDLVQSVSDACNPISLSNVTITKVTSDEGSSTGGDILIGGNCRSVQLRADREGKGDGRVYTITLSVRDAAGNTTTMNRKVTVPRDQGQGSTAVDSGTAYAVVSSCQ